MSANYYNVNLVNLGAGERRIAQKAVAAHREALAAAKTADGPAWGFIEPSDPRWDPMWQDLGDNPINAGLSNPRKAFNCMSGECWQYMGTINGMHQFRHRCHPSTKRREYVNIPVS